MTNIATPTRYITWKRGAEYAATPIPANETTLNPDPDGTCQRMLQAGWITIHVDPLPGVTMKFWRPNHRSYGSSFD